MGHILLPSTIDFHHAFQPIVDIDSWDVMSYEVLLRAENGASPSDILSKVDKKHLMAFDQASRERAIARAAYLGLQCGLSLNFPPKQILFGHGEYIDRTISCALRHGIKPEQLIIEITESEVIEDMPLFVEVLNKLRRTGVTVAIDDFGAGYAGLNMLAEIQPDLVKIDMQLIRDISQDGPRQSIVKGITTICFDLGIDVLAEGVETREEFKFLQRLGIKLYQGYFFAHPDTEILPLTVDEVPVSLPA